MASAPGALLSQFSYAPRPDADDPRSEFIQKDQRRPQHLNPVVTVCVGMWSQQRGLSGPLVLTTCSLYLCAARGVQGAAAGSGSGSGQCIRAPGGRGRAPEAQPKGPKAQQRCGRRWSAFLAANSQGGGPHFVATCSEGPTPDTAPAMLQQPAGQPHSSGGAGCTHSAARLTMRMVLLLRCAVPRVDAAQCRAPAAGVREARHVAAHG